MNITRVNHLGVIVADLERSIADFQRRLGLRLDRTERYADLLEIAFLPCGDTQIELIEPLSEDDPAARYLRRNGPGIQHVAFEVDDIEAALAEVSEGGTRILGDAPRRGAGGTRIAFLDPRDFGGILVELCEDPASA